MESESPGQPVSRHTKEQRHNGQVSLLLTLIFVYIVFPPTFDPTAAGPVTLDSRQLFHWWPQTNDFTGRFSGLLHSLTEPLGHGSCAFPSAA